MCWRPSLLRLKLLLAHQRLLNVEVLLPRVRPICYGNFLVRFVADRNVFRGCSDLFFGFIYFDLDFSLLLDFAVALLFVAFLF